jgi:hypothetical protein
LSEISLKDLLEIKPRRWEDVGAREQRVLTVR